MFRACCEELIKVSCASSSVRRSAALACAGLLIAAAPAGAKSKNKTVVGCVEASSAGFDLVAVSKKGKTKHYGLSGSHDFSHDVGHRVQVSGVKGKGVFNVGSVHTMAGRCR